MFAHDEVQIHIITYVWFNIDGYSIISDVNSIVH